MPERGAPAALSALLAALEFYTRIPRPRAVRWDPAHAERASAFAPVAGWVVAVFAGVVWWLVAVVLPEPLPVIAAVAAAVWITGALHEDGFADVCDGLGGSRDPERALEIMKDPRAGAFAVVGVTLMLAIRVALLHQIATLAGGDVATVVAALIAAHGFSRFAAVSVSARVPYLRGGRPGARAGPFASPLAGRDRALAAATGLASLVPLLVISPWALAGSLAAAWLARASLLALFRLRLGGVTGDCLGTVQQVTEVAVYAATAAVLHAAVDGGLHP